jgi:uncharacterized protein (TIGR02594 family)
MASVATAVRANGGFIRLGSQGSAVRIAQLELAKLGYKLAGTGYFGGATDAATTAFQKQYGLTQDGIIGPRTAEAIDKMVMALAAGDSTVRDLVKQASPFPIWTHYGMSYLGLKEGAGGSDNPEILEWAKEEGGSTAKVYVRDSIAWCALFANMTLTKCNLKGTETLWALDFDSDTKWPNKKLSGPAVGAFMPMKRTGGGHITQCVGRALVSGTWCLMGLGGNQSDSVSIAAFPKERPNSYRWPEGPSIPSQVGFDSLPVITSTGKISSKET